MNGRSTAVPKIGISAGAGLIAAVSLGTLTAGDLSTKQADSVVNAATGSSHSFKICNGLFSGGVRSAGAGITYPVDEKWEEGKHAPELRQLIAKKASSKGMLSKGEAARLAALQQMRRETLPMATSYEEFIRERERLDELVRITEALEAYERKYGSAANV
ncbi:MAG: hypothetical protein IJG18_13650 [Kiritimatiellae bacterium]|nr:hypothetical protein [Kiritimatiellia bacterium]MBQ3315438.1 hypothetical protein [Kiritimatiellia bacterium]